MYTTGTGKIIFAGVPGLPEQSYEGVIHLVNGGVMHYDHDHNLRWHPPQVVRMVIFDERPIRG